MSHETNRVTIRGGTVFVPKGGRLESVSIFDSRVICDCKEGDVTSLENFLRARAHSVTVQDCSLEPASSWAKRTTDAIFADQGTDRLIITFTPPKLSLWGRIKGLFR